MRLIDADKLKAHYSWWNDDNQRVFDQIVDAQPTALDLVHCPECRWCEGGTTLYCPLLDLEVDELNYCGSGERRSDVAN